MATMGPSLVYDEVRKRRSGVPPRYHSREMIHRIVFFGAAALISLGSCRLAYSQGMATGGVAPPRRPLPPGFKPPVIRYEDIAAQSGLTGLHLSLSTLHNHPTIQPTQHALP